MYKNLHFLWKLKTGIYRINLLGGELVKQKFYHIILILFLVLSACGDSSDSDEATSETPQNLDTTTTTLPESEPDTGEVYDESAFCLLYTSPSPRD